MDRSRFRRRHALRFELTFQMFMNTYKVKKSDAKVVQNL